MRPLQAERVQRDGAATSAALQQQLAAAQKEVAALRTAADQKASKVRRCRRVVTLTLCTAACRLQLPGRPALCLPGATPLTSRHTLMMHNGSHPPKPWLWTPS